LNLDGTIRWVSTSWVDVIGTPAEGVPGTKIVDLIESDNKSCFTDVVDSMKRDDSRSQFIRFTAKLGPLSKLMPLDSVKESEDLDRPQHIDLEAQGIMVYDRTSGGESHTMWMIRPWIPPREIKIDLPPILVDSLGSGAEVLASILTQLAEAGLDNPANHPPPMPVLCRICERQIPPWWFEKHTDLCLQEHEAEMEVQMAQENLTDHRHNIVKVLDALEARKSRSLTEPATLPMAEYKGLPIGPPSSSSSPGTSSPGPSGNGSRERSSGFGHARARSFAIRRPQARIVELVLDLCDTALEISPPAIKESSQTSGDFRTQSPQSESRVSQVMQWQSPSTNTVEQEQGLALLCADTERLAKAKVDAVFRHRRILEYSERIRVEFAVLVQECIDEAVRKTKKIAAGELSDSSDAEGEEEATPATEEAFFSGSFDAPSSLALALQQANISDDPEQRRRSAAVESTKSSSPKEAPTPRSHRGALSSLTGPSRRESLLFESDAGDSDGSLRSSSIASRQPRTDSPISEFGDLRRAASSRRGHRTSLILPGTSSPRRQESPSRLAQPSSPLRVHKGRSLAFPSEGLVSPEASPMLPTSEFSSPAALAQHHHRRQSSAALSLGTGETGMRLPPSPRLNAVSAPQARPVAPSIKDFEIIKPISKGAFGSVYLSKKKSTGEYFAIKVLKKADMVAKNQVTNVKAERAIMMWQGESDFVAKLYWTFSSKDYLYLVMEYLNGGDCASLIKVLGGLPEDWVKKYLGEVVLGVEHLHSRGIIHRDLKPDNLLIDQKGHLKLTDFGLSRMGLIGRQKRALNSSGDTAPDLLKQGPFARSASMASSRSTSLDLQGVHSHSPGATPQMTPLDTHHPGLPQPSYFSLGSGPQESRRVSSQRSDSGGTEALTQMLGTFSLHDNASASSQAVLSPQDTHSEGDGVSNSPDLASLHQTASQTSTAEPGKNTPPPSNSMPPPNWALFDPKDTNRRFVGTPDYLAPETINGETQDETSDWWSVGCILYEFLYGIPPFHAESADQVFENILARRLVFPEEADGEVSAEAKDLMNQLLCTDARQRLGANRDEKFASGGEEIRNHPWFTGVNWETLLQDEAQFVPQPENIEDTEYFDARGATLQAFTEEIEDQLSPPSAPGAEYPDRPHDALARVRSQVNSIKRGMIPLHIPPHVRDLKSRRLSEPVVADDFGNFAFKNLPVLEKANKDVIQKLRAEALATSGKGALTGGNSHQPSSPVGGNLEGSPMLSAPVQRSLSNAKASQRPQSPSGLGHINSSPSRASQPSSPLLLSFVAGQGSEGRRKASSTSSQTSGPSLQPGSFFDLPRVPPSLQKAATTAGASPVKGRAQPPPLPLPLSPQKLSTPRQPSVSGTRSRSLTVGSHEGSPIAPDLSAHQRNRRSQVFDMSPSSSDNEGEKANQAYLRVQRRRQSSRRMSQIIGDNPGFRPLDVLICEDHPVARMVMEKLLEKLRCRTIAATTGPEAVRYAMSEVKFDIILMEFKLPQINGADVARMIRETKNANSHTPLVAITAYLKELQAPHYFDSLIEKPISSSKLIEVIANLCQWKPASPATPSNPLSLAIAHPAPSGLRQESLRSEDSPTSGSSYAARTGSSFRGSSRGDSISSSLIGDSESVSTMDDYPVVVSRKPTNEWDEGLGISQEEVLLSSSDPTKAFAPLIVQHSAPAQVEYVESPSVPAPRRSSEKLRAKRESTEKRRSEGNVDSADDEDEELGLAQTHTQSNSGSAGSTGGNGSSGAVGNGSSHSRQHYRGKSTLPSSKLGIEMMRANSHDSVTVASSECPSTIEPATQVVTPNHELQQFDLPVFTTPLRAGEISSPAVPVLSDGLEGEEGDGDTTVIISAPAEPSSPVATESQPYADVDMTPRPPPQTDRIFGEDQPTPRPPAFGPLIGKSATTGRTPR
jgi:serine/threonine-protein kinase RIM15